ncbi:TPA: hypothetical protein DCG61_01710 [Patescibacteria group bacterium]|jgi:hypothetical protein|nr:hypothetical protein [Patescibacteria group bacterium]
MNIITKTIFAGFIILITTATVNIASAATIYPATSSPTVSTGGVFIVDVLLNTEGKTINTVEGELELVSDSQSYEVVEFLLGGSDFTLWTERPQIVKSGSTTYIKFTGGTPSGLNKANALVMKIAMRANDANTVEIKPLNAKVFLHDGAGTSKTASVRPLSLRIVEASPDEVVQDALRDIIALDNNPPEPFVIELGRDAALFDGKWFVSFFAVDNESGIAYYEVKEGDRTAVRSGTTYVLQDQTLKSKITVTAYDKAGNSRVQEWTPQGGFWSKLLGKAIVILGVILILLGIWFVVSKIKTLWRKRKQNQNSSQA